MSQTKAHPDHPHKSKQEKVEETFVDASPNPIPAPEQGSHAQSHAAHLHTEATEHVNPAGNLRQSMTPGALRQPPENITRSGKQHRD